MARNAYQLDYKVKKWPVQARSKASFDAIIQACAWILVEEGYAAATTNRIAEKAGVNIASLYEYFPNKESIVAVLTERELNKYVQAITTEMQQGRKEDEAEMVAYVLRWGINRIQEDRGLLSILLLEVPFIASLPSVQAVMNSALTVIQMAMSEDERLQLPDPETGAWLITRMCFNTGMEIASNQFDEERREKLIQGFGRFCFRLLFARDLTPKELRYFAA